MSRFLPFPLSQRAQCALRILAAAVIAASLPALSSAQTAGRISREEERKLPATISAEQMSGRPDREVVFERNVEIVRGPTTITADKATYRIVEDEVEGEGNIRMCRYGDVYTGDLLRLKLGAQEGYVLNPTYKLELNNAQGRADRIDFLGEGLASVSGGTYSTCEGPDPDWYLKSSTLDLDRLRDVGVAHGSTLYFKGFPILAAPSMSFPLSDERKSGVLPPTFGTTSRGGFELTVPYYFNIAPNRDLTLYPKLYARRGLQLGVEGRYLGHDYYGETRAEYLSNDNRTGTNRYAVSSTHTQTLMPGLVYAWNLNDASDDDYPTDFSSTITAAKNRLLPRDMTLSYNRGGDWSAMARVSNYQVLQDPRNPITRPYDRLPQLNFFSGRQDVSGFDWNADAEFTRFSHPDPDPVRADLATYPHLRNLYPERGDRLVVNPRIAYPFIRPGYFVTPKLSLHATQYSLDYIDSDRQVGKSRVLPTLSLDSGLVFERDTTFFGNGMTQTLEPRLFYVYTPYRDQSDLPLFDSAEADLSFAQLFSENRFIGNDRIGDANQLTAAVISRYIEPGGAERMRFVAGQRFHFNRQRVTLGNTLPNVREDTRSDLLLSAYGRLTQATSVESNIQYSQTQDRVVRSNYGVRWQPAPKSVLNLQYRLDRGVPQNRFEQVDASAQWPLASRWYGVARVNYSLPDKKVAESLLGFEYKADCWIFRMVGQRTPTATGVTSSAVFFQLELNGLARLGSNPLEALRSNIPGYQLINQPTP